MGVVSNTLQTFDRKELREDLSNVINDLTPEETPLYSMIAKTKATNVKHEWLWDRCAAPAANAVTQGDDPAADAASALTRFFNYTQLMDKVVRIGSTQRATDNAGYEDSMAYQMAKRALELRKDLDFALCQNGQATAGAADTPMKMAGLELWLGYGSPTPRGNMTANGTCIATTTATTPGFLANYGCLTAVADASADGLLTVSETIVKSCIENVVLNSNTRVSQMLMYPTLKARFAGTITGIATRYREVPRGQAAIVSGADLYVSNFGDITLNFSRQMRYSATQGGPVFGLDPKQLACAFLQPFKQEPLAKTGHAESRMISCEATLVVKDPQALFKIGNVNYFTAG